MVMKNKIKKGLRRTTNNAAAAVTPEPPNSEVREEEELCTTLCTLSELGGGEREEDLVTHDEFSWIVPYNSVQPSPLSICD